MKHIITALVENQPGVLARIVGLISGRGYNIDSLNVGPMPDGSMSRMTITVPGDDRVLEQVTKQLNKLVDVIKVTDLTKESHIERELFMIKVSSSPKSRSEIVELATLFGATIVCVRAKHLIVQIAGPGEDVASFIDLVKNFGIVEMSRSGTIAMDRD